MKKTLFMLFIVVLLGACLGENEFDDVTYTITNDSSKTVSFTFNDTLETLDTGGSITYNINSEKGRFIPKNITIENGHPRSINLTAINNGTAGIFYTFSDNTPLNLDVTNTLPLKITIKADNFIDVPVVSDEDDEDDEDIEGEEEAEIDDPVEQVILTALTIDANDNKSAFIYTSAPKFTVIPEESDPIPPYPYHVIIDWELKGDTIFVIISSSITLE